MRNDDSLSPSWQTPLIIAIAVILIVLAALILTQIDNVQRRSLLPPQRLTIVDQEATIIATEPGNIYFPGDEVVTATPSPTIDSIPSTLTHTPEPTAVAMIKPACDADRDNWVPYVVQQGNSLTSLAFKYGINKTSIIQMNCLTFQKLIVGQIIYLPENESARPEKVQCGVPPNWTYYVVHPGDTLLQLAEKYDSTVYKIMNANCLETTQLSPGRKLFLPSLKPTQVSPTRANPTSTRPKPRITAAATQTRQFFPTITPTPTPLPFITVTQTPTAISVTASPSPTETIIPTETHTPAPTETMVMPTNTPTTIPTEAPTNTSTPIPPTSTFTSTPPLPTPTSTPIPPSPTPMLATSTATVSVHPSAQPTATSTVASYP